MLHTIAMGLATAAKLCQTMFDGIVDVSAVEILLRLFSIELFHLIVIRRFDVVFRAIGRSLFMVLTTCVLGGPPKK